MVQHERVEPSHMSHLQGLHHPPRSSPSSPIRLSTLLFPQPLASRSMEMRSDDWFQPVIENAWANVVGTSLCFWTENTGNGIGLCLYNSAGGDSWAWCMKLHSQGHPGFEIHFLAWANLRLGDSTWINLRLSCQRRKESEAHRASTSWSWAILIVVPSRMTGRLSVEVRTSQDCETKAHTIDWFQTLLQTSRVSQS